MSASIHDSTKVAKMDRADTLCTSLLRNRPRMGLPMDESESWHWMVSLDAEHFATAGWHGPAGDTALFGSGGPVGEAVREEAVREEAERHEAERHEAERLLPELRADRSRGDRHTSSSPAAKKTLPELVLTRRPEVARAPTLPEQVLTCCQCGDPSTDGSISLRE